MLIPVQGVLIVFLFTPQHQATHKTPFARAWLNEWAGRICGFLARGRLRVPYLPEAALPRMARGARWILAGYGMVLPSFLAT